MSSVCSTSVSTCSDSTSKSEHQRLASVVKAVHSKLRKKYKKGDGFEELWEEHIKNKDLLSEYADAMHHLAVDHWSKHPETRIDWCRNVCIRYFIYGELQRVLEKDARRKAFKSQTEDKLKELKVDDARQSASEPISIDASNGVTTPCTRTLKGKNDSSNCSALVEDQKAASPNNSAVLISSLDDLQDATNLLAEKCSLRSENSVSDLQVSVVPYQEQPVESKVEEYLEQLQDSPCNEECLQAMGDGADFSQETLDENAIYSNYGPTNYTTVTAPVKGKLRLLDVGSCYNAFLQFDEFVAIGVDISPAVESVFTCDFLHLEMLEPLQLAQDTHDSWVAGLRSPITRLPKDCFHVVVFSLLLEYFPSPYQRWLCCQKAHQLLMMNGLLLIITPDSHHVNRGAPQMKSWKVVIESLGFKRYKYEKQDHLHCMAFRKVAHDPDNTLLSDITPDLLYIPQDFNNGDNLDDDQLFNEPRNEQEDDELCQNFMELPDFAIF